MSADPQDFEGLRKLLKLKRYEQPPPRYFNDFSLQVLNGIRNEAHAGRESRAEYAGEGFSWLDRVLGTFQRQPLFAGVFGAAVCALLLMGVAYSERTDVNPSTAVLTDSQPRSTALPQAATIFSQDTALMVSSTNPITPVSGSIFDAIPYPTAMPVNQPGRALVKP